MILGMVHPSTRCTPAKKSVHVVISAELETVNLLFPLIEMFKAEHPGSAVAVVPCMTMEKPQSQVGLAVMVPKDHDLLRIAYSADYVAVVMFTQSRPVKLKICDRQGFREIMANAETPE